MRERILWCLVEFGIFPLESLTRETAFASAKRRLSICARGFSIKPLRE
jgi:hypothetical protein